MTPVIVVLKQNVEATSSLVIGIVVVTLAGLLFGRCRNSSGRRFQTVAVTRGPITEAVTATGTLNPVQNVQVGSQVSGNIQKLFADFNSIVKAGQVIAQIDRRRISG